jgi:hypothetical protein
VSDLDALVTQNAALVTGVLVIVLAALAVAVVVVARRARRLEARLEALTRGEDGRDLAGVLDAHLARVLAVARRQDELDAHAVALETQAGRSVQGVGFVRFNTFEDTGVNSLHARNQTRLYAKAVRAGGAEGAFSDEEAEAVRLAVARAHGR